MEAAEQAVIEEATEEAKEELPKGHVRIKTSGKVKADGPNKGKTVEIEYVVDLGHDLVDAAEKFTQDAVHSLYVSGARVAAAGLARNQIEQGADPDVIVAHMENVWYPGYRASGAIDPEAQKRAVVQTISDDELVAILASRGLNPDGTPM